jgi:glutaminase
MVQNIVDNIYQVVKSEGHKGRVAEYIPELAKIDPGKLGISLKTIDGQLYQAGDAHESFSIQSISKVFATSLVFSVIGDDLWRRVGKEPSGSSFNSLVQLEYENGIPRNPLINAGAIVVADMMIDILANPEKDFLSFLRRLAGDQTIHFDEKVKNSEKNTGFRNVALANFMKSFGNIHNHVDEVLEVYFMMCSVSMSCTQLANAFLFFANHGMIPATNEKILTISQTKRLNALMQTCGFYDEAGEFTFRVGLPGKSGVGGGIVAILPKQYSVAVWSPGLNAKGNSAAGIQLLELLTTKTGTSIF